MPSVPQRFHQEDDDPRLALRRVLRKTGTADAFSLGAVCHLPAACGEGMIPLLIAGLYLIAGAWIALEVDEAQMKKPVPYGEFPSLLTLEQIRHVVFLLFIFVGPPVFVRQFFRMLWRGELTKGRANVSR
jgi:hypothetical protein